MTPVKRPKKIPPSKDIGPAYKLLGVIVLFVAIGLIFIHGQSGLTWIDFGVFLTLVMMFILLVRPDKFDGLVKTIADSLPFLKYKKDE